MPSDNETSPTVAQQQNDVVAGVVSTSASEKRRIQWLQKQFRHLRSLLHYRLPNLTILQDPEVREYVRNRDEQSNVATRVPPDAELRLRALWGVEIFGPKEADGLFAALKRLGWDDDEQRAKVGAGASQWISEQRTYGSGGNFNLGLIHRKGQRTFFPTGLHAPVPESVDYMSGYIYQVSPSITAIILCFVLTDEISTSYESALNTDRRTRNQSMRRSGGYHILDVEHLKRNAVEEIRLNSRRMVTRWFHDNLPGFFSLACDGNRLPTGELITTANKSLYLEPSTAPHREQLWARLLTGYSFRDIWTLKSFNGLSLALNESNDMSRFHSIVTLQTDLLRDEHLKYMGERGTPTYTAFVCYRVQGILVRFAVIGFLRDVIRTLRITRDTISAKMDGYRAVLRTIAHIKSFFDMSIGVPTMTAELAMASEQGSAYCWDCEDFESQPWRPSETPAKIADTLRTRTHYLATRTLAQEKETREHLEQVSTILSTRESIKAQKKMEIMTIVAILVAAASLLVALMSVDQLSTTFFSQVERLFNNS
ncbi:MAG TPA: hypothetical protein VFK96_08040 [Gammaproteobacteria bacterium]|nr:hypothetical protein [Gammaproteobacteria bacterium]